MAANSTLVREAPAHAQAAAGDADVEYGGFWIRLLAYVADAAIIFLGLLVLMVPAAFLGAAGAYIYGTLCWAGPILYFAAMHASERQATFGKELLGLKVTHAADGTRLSFLRSLVRELAKFISAALLGLGFVLAAFTSRKQGLHDFIAGTVVVRERSGRVFAAVAVIVAGILIPAVAIPVMMGAFVGTMMLAMVGGLMGGLMGGGMGEMMKRPAPQVAQPAARPTPAQQSVAEAPAPVSSPQPPATTPPASAPQPQSAGEADFDQLAGQPLTGLERPGTTRAGPAILELSTVFSSSVWIKVYLPPVRDLDLMPGPKVTVNRVADRAGTDYYDASSSFEKGEFFLRARLSPEAKPVAHLAGTRSVNLKPGLNETALEEIAGAIKVALPAGATPVAFEAGETGKDKSASGATVALRSLQGPDVTLYYRGKSAHMLGVRGYGADGKAVPLESWQNLPEGRDVDQTFSVKFKSPVTKVEAVVAASVVEREFPFTLKKGVTAGPPS